MNLHQQDALVHDRIAVYGNIGEPRQAMYPVLAGQEPLPHIIRDGVRIPLLRVETVDAATDRLLEDIRAADAAGELDALLEDVA